MRPYFISFETGQIHFDGATHRHERNRKPRLRAQKLYIRFGGSPWLPLRIEHYATPKFYDSNLMNHRRKLDLDQGLSKLRHGRCRIDRIASKEAAQC